MRKFLSRKFLYPIVYGLLVVFNRKIGLGLSEMELGSIGATVVSFIAGESLIDLKKK